MNTLDKYIKRKNIPNKRFLVLSLLLSITTLLGVTKVSAADTSPQYIQGNDTLVVYSDVPGLTPSEFYTIKVRSAATNNEWIGCYANITRSLWSSLPTNAQGTNNTREHYYTYVKDWSHTYANIEMSRGSRVEVQILAKNGFKIKGNNFTSANAHPAHKASKPTVVDNIVYFTIENPGQITIDINGQMDETNTGNEYSGPPIHTVSLFANPVIKKPKIGDPGVLVVNPGSTVPVSMGSNTTLYFAPGIHAMGRNYKLASSKNYYIPGDAIVYGSFNNVGVGSVANVRIYGYGTLSGDRTKHPSYDPEFSGDDKTWKTIYTDNCTNFRVEGICIANPPFHSINLNASRSPVKQTFCHWVKIISWRGNGDGIGTAHETYDCFIRTQDDCSYVKGDKKRCVFWSDVNGAAFVLAGMPAASERSIVVEDCDVIYPRHCSTTWNGGRVFSKRAEQAPTEFGITNVNITFRDIRITDKFQTLETFHLKSKDGSKSSGGFSGITFQNITSVKTPAAGDNVIIGHSGGPWNDITFENVVLGGKRFKSVADFGQIGENVSNLKFINTTTSLREKESFDGESKNEITIYSNRVADMLYINSKGKIISNIQLFDMSGREVDVGNVSNQNGTINLSGKAGGLYIVKIHTGDNIFTTKVRIQ